MRIDYHKKLCERGRSRWTQPRWSRYDDKESVRAGRTRSFRDNFAPVLRMLKGRVGKPWDTVYSELCQRYPLRKRTTTVRWHLHLHICRDLVCLRPMRAADGTYRREGGYRLRTEELFVDDHGVLQQAKPRRRRS